MGKSKFTQKEANQLFKENLALKVKNSLLRSSNAISLNITEIDPRNAFPYMYLSQEIMEKTPKIIFGNDRKANINSLGFFQQLTKNLIILSNIEHGAYEYSYKIHLLNGTVYEAESNEEPFTIVGFEYLDSKNGKLIRNDYSKIKEVEFLDFNDCKEVYVKFNIDSIQYIEFLSE